jgi:lysophospholipase L1-like esterase
MKKKSIPGRALTLIALLLLFSTTASFAQSKYHPLYHQRATLFEELPVKSSDIVFLGNSITHFGEWHELFDNPNIKNRGISGDIAQGVYDRLDPILTGKPAKIFLLIGINDVSHDVSADSIVRAISKIVVKICNDSPQTKLYIQSVLPVNPDFGLFLKATTRGDEVLKINSGLKELCSKHNLTYIDAYSALKEEVGEKLRPEYTNDGLHLLGKGYIKWAEVLRGYLN